MIRSVDELLACLQAREIEQLPEFLERDTLLHSLLADRGAAVTSVLQAVIDEAPDGVASEVLRDLLGALRARMGG